MINDLYHYGVRGMKWGVRNPNASNKRKKEKTKGKIKTGFQTAIEDYTRYTTKGQKAFDIAMASIGTAFIVGGGILKGKEKIHTYSTGKKVAYEILNKTGETIYTKYL